MFVTVLGIVKEVKPVHSLNTPLMFVKDAEMVIEVRLEHLQNGALPMLVTEFGMVIEVRLEQLPNA